MSPQVPDEDELQDDAQYVELAKEGSDDYVVARIIEETATTLLVEVVATKQTIFLKKMLH
jgi:hypothetical protein